MTSTDLFARTMDRRAFLRGVALMGAVAVGSQLSAFPAHAADADATTPAGAVRGVHISWTGDPTTTLTAVWFTYGTTDPGSTVQWAQLADGAAAPAVLPLSAVGFSTALPFGAGLAHEATITGLVPGGRLAYRVGSSDAWSEVFATATMLGGDAPFRFSYYGDQGPPGNPTPPTPATQVGGAPARTGPAVLASRPAFCLIAGDLSYASDFTAQAQMDWIPFFDLVEPMTSVVPIMCALGNHDSEDAGDNVVTPVGSEDTTGGSVENYQTRFAHPTNGGGRPELRYSFDAGRVHLVSLQASESFNTNDATDEMRFLQTDLAQAYADREAGLIDFIVVFQHFPIYCNESDRAPGDMTLMTIQDPIFQQYEIDLLLVGHNHQYERSYPMVQGRVVEMDESADPDGGPQYGPDRVGYVQVIQGGGGRDVYTFLPDASIAAWSAVRASTHGITTVDYVPTSATRSAILRVHTYDTDAAEPGGAVPVEYAKAPVGATAPGALIDQFTLARRTAAVTPPATTPEVSTPVLLPIAAATITAAILAGRAQRASQPHREC